jgi:hypothetical protein
MGAENNKGEILSSWKEIAGYLNCGVRTCMRYEEKYGLSIHRLEEKPKTHVFAYKNELDEWIKKRANLKENNRTEIKYKQKRHKVIYLIFAVIVIGMSILLLYSFLFKNEIPSNFHIEGSKLGFPHFRGHTEEFDIISSLEVRNGRNERSEEIRSGI